MANAPLDADVVVAGAGPAGTAAAIHLLRAGHRVTVVDKATFPRDKCCGDGLTAGALRHLERLGFRPRLARSWHRVDTVQVRSPSGRVVPFPLPADGVHAAVVRRVELDAALLDLARAEGADVREGAGVTAVVVADDRVDVEVEGEEVVAASWLVAADGVWSPTRKLVDDGTTSDERYLGEWHAFRQYVVTTSPAARDLWVWFEPDLLPGYAWSFPLPDQRANVGFGVRREAGRPTAGMADQWRNLLDRPHVREVLGADAAPEAAHKAWPIPASVEVPLSAAGGRVLFVGDAARVADPMTGEGIGQAFETAELAARAITVAGSLAPAGAARVYEAEVRRKLYADNRFADALSRALAHRKGARAAVRLAGMTRWTRRNFARWLFEDYPRAVAITPRRWRAGMFTPPGAFPDAG